jgi:hypothetical protein
MQFRCEVDDGLFVAESRTVPEPPELFDPACFHPDLFFELAKSSRLRRFTFLVAGSRRDLQEVAPDRRSELPHQKDPAAICDRDDRYRTRMVDDLTIEPGAIRSLD